MYKPIEIDRANLTIMGVYFPDLDTLNRTADAIGSNMFEGFEPTPKLISLYAAFRNGEINGENLIEALKKVI
jgi:putative transcriptional regulator